MHQSFTWLCRYYFKINTCWPIVTSWIHEPAARYCDVTTNDCSHGFLWTHGIEVAELIQGGWDNLWSRELFSRRRHNFAYRSRITAHWAIEKFAHLFLFNLFVYYTILLIFGPSFFKTRPLRGRGLFGKCRHNTMAKGNAHGANNDFDHIAVLKLCQLIWISWWTRDIYTFWFFLYLCLISFSFSHPRVSIRGIASFLNISHFVCA